MKTIKTEVSDLFVVKKSEFIGIAAPVLTMEDALDRIDQAWKNHGNARHIAWAVKVSNRVRMNDDGEPSGTAGMPILNVIQHQDLQNLLVLVIRYFGGIKLGAGGLTRAYSHAAAIAIQKSEFVEFVPMQSLELIFQFSREAQIRRIVSQFDGVISDIFYKADCHMIVEVGQESAETFSQQLMDACHGKIEVIQQPKTTE